MGGIGGWGDYFGVGVGKDPSKAGGGTVREGKQAIYRPWDCFQFLIFKYAN